MKSRSPNYPSISLDEAVERTRLIYEQVQRHKAPREVIARAIGYGTLNGASSSIISALTKYGLLDRIGDQRSVSEIALDTLLYEKGDIRRVRAVQQAAFLPPLFSELHARYGDTLPNDHLLSADLQKRGFNPKTVGDVIRAYRDTLEFVDAETRDSKVSEETLEMKNPEEQLQVQSAALMGSNTTSLFDQSTPQHKHVLSFNLAEDCNAQVIITGSVTREAIETFIKYLEISLSTYPSRETIQRRDTDRDDVDRGY